MRSLITARDPTQGSFHLIENTVVKMHRMPYLLLFIFRKRALSFMALLQKENCNLRYCTHFCHSVPHASFSILWQDSFICVTWLMYVCAMTHSYMWHDSFTCVTWLIHACDLPHSYVWHDYSYVWHDWFICVTWLTYMWHKSFICVSWRILMRDMTPLHVWHDSFTRVIWLIHTCDMTHSHRWHDSLYQAEISLICVTWLNPTNIYVYIHIFIYI